jgi:hypothetical protein
VVIAQREDKVVQAQARLGEIETLLADAQQPARISPATDGVCRTRRTPSRSKR